MSSPPSAPRPVGADSGTSPCPASTRPFPGEGSPGRRKARRGAGARGRRTPTPRPSLGVRGLEGSVPPTPLGFGGPAPCEFSLTPQTRSESDPSKTRFSTRAGSSAGTGSNQRRDAFSPRRRDPRCKKTQPRRPHRFGCSLPRTTVFPPDVRGAILLIGSGRPRQFLLLRPQLLFSFPSSPFMSQPLQGTMIAGALRGSGTPQIGPSR